MSRWQYAAILLHYEDISLIDSQHGLTLEETPIAHQQGKTWLLGSQVPFENGKHENSKHLLADLDFPLDDFFEWFVGRFYSWRKLRLWLMSAESWSPLTLNLWQDFFKRLGLREPLQIQSPLQALAFSLKQGLLVYVADGNCQIAVCQQGQILNLSQIGYGFYLTRALRKHALDRYQLELSVITAEQAWLRLGAGVRQVTIEGLNPAGQNARQLLIIEELEAAFQQAFTPLKQELTYLKQLHPELSIRVFGPHADWLQQYWQEINSFPLVIPSEHEALLVNSIQHYIKGQRD